MKSEVFGSAITELQEAVDRLMGQYINLMTRVRELEGIVHPPAAGAGAPEIVTLPSGWAIIRVEEAGRRWVFTQEDGLVPHYRYGKEYGENDVAWFASEHDAEMVVDLLGLRDVRVARLYRDTLGEVK